MDNHLTPNKIQRLMRLAEDKSLSMTRRMILNDEDIKRLTTSQMSSKSSQNYESSSGLLDLDRIEGFGESGIGNEISLSKSTAFNPGEMTGRSTETENANDDAVGSKMFESFGRHSLALESITSQMNKQTSEVEDVMRHSIATNYTFHSKRDLTADEASLIIREAPLPVRPSTHTNFADSLTLNNSNISMGTYFKNRCPEFGKMLGKTDSPDRSLRPSISEVSTSMAADYAGKETNILGIDHSLDSIPVKQARSTLDKKPDNRIVNNFKEKQNNCDIASKQDPYSVKYTAKIENSSLVQDAQKSEKQCYNQNPIVLSKKSFMNPTSTAPTDILLRNLQCSLKLVADDTEGSVENSLSISKIADYLGKQSNVSVTDMLQNHMKKPLIRKHPLTELPMNTQDRVGGQNLHVTSLKDSKNLAAASTSSSINTVISVDKLKLSPKEVPIVCVTQHSSKADAVAEEQIAKSKSRSSRSKSPSSKSHSTLSTVHENYSSFKSGDSPQHINQGEAKCYHMPSPNVVYRELDKSVDWGEVLLQSRSRQEGFAKEQWVEIVSTPAEGYVGASFPVTFTVTTLTDSWLTAKFQFDALPNEGKNLTIELPRLPLLLSPGKTENISFHLTSSAEMNRSLPFTMFLRDTSIEGEIEQKGTIDVHIKMPEIQAMSFDGVNKLSFPPTVEKSSLCKSFVLLSASPVDLLLELCIGEGDGMFSIKNVQEIKKSDINKALTDKQGNTDVQFTKGKQKVTNKQLCRLSNGNGIKVTIVFNAPKLSDLHIIDGLASFGGTLKVNLMGKYTVLRTVELLGIVGIICLNVDATDNIVRLTNDTTKLKLINSGTIPGEWIAMIKNDYQNVPINISPKKFEIRPGLHRFVNVSYTGSEESLFETSIVFEEITTGLKTIINVVAGAKTFPIKTNHNNLSWVRSGRKDLNLKNTSNSKVHIKCQIIGDGFSIDLPGAESKGTFLLPFGPMECRRLPIVFTPNSYLPQTATLHVVYDKVSDVSRKVRLYGSDGGEAVAWWGMVTYGLTALVRAVARDPIKLTLYNKAHTPAFVCATVHFNLQYMCVASTARLEGGRHIIPARSKHTLTLLVEWGRAEGRARAGGAPAALAALTALTGPAHTRRRILRILKQDSGEMDTSVLPDHLKIIAENLEGDDDNLDAHLTEFQESKASINELIDGLQELTAQIDLPQDFSDENTIIITDDTIVEHHTMRFNLD